MVYKQLKKHNGFYKKAVVYKQLQTIYKPIV